MKKVAGIVALCLGLALVPVAASAHYKRHRHHSHHEKVIVSVGAGVAKSTNRSAADQKLYEKAWAICSSSSYPSDTHPHINYSGGWFRCVEPEWLMR